MPTEVITGLNGGVALTATASGDKLPVTDVSDTTEAATGTTKPIAITDLLRVIFSSLALSGDISPAQITANQNDYNPTGLADAAVLRLSTDASRNITSIAGGADGRVLLIHNVGAFNIVLKDDDGATGTAGNRFALSTDITLLPDQSALIQYDSTTSRWRMVAGPPSPGAAGVGDVVGPGSATDNAIARYDSTTGKLIQSSNLTLPDDAASTEVGYLNIPQNSQSANYTTVMADRGKHILHPLADNNPRTFTIDSNANVAYPIGTAITFINEINTVTIAITSDTLTLVGAGTTGSRTLAANGIATAIKITSTKWMIDGSGLT